MPDVLEQDTELQTDALETPATTEDGTPADGDTDAQEPVETEPAQPEVPQAVLELMQRQQQVIEEMRNAQQPKPEAPPALEEFLKQGGVDEGTAKLFALYDQWKQGVDKEKFLPRDYGHLLHHVASVTDQNAATESIKRDMKATDAELSALAPHMEAVRKEYGNLPLKAAQKLALVSLRSGKSASGLSAARDAKKQGLQRLPQPNKNGGPALAAGKVSDEDYEKLSPLQRIAVLNGKDPAAFAGM